MAIPVSSLQKVDPSAIIELFQLQLIEGIHYSTGNAPASSDNGKYYFQPDQRDEVEEEIIQGTTIAKDTKKLQQTKEEFEREQLKNISLQEATRKSEASLY